MWETHCLQYMSVLSWLWKFLNFIHLALVLLYGGCAHHILQHIQWGSHFLNWKYHRWCQFWLIQNKSNPFFKEYVWILMQALSHFQIGMFLTCSRSLWMAKMQEKKDSCTRQQLPSKLSTIFLSLEDILGKLNLKMKIALLLEF